MTINLTSYESIQSNLFVRIEIDEYRTTPSGSYTSEILRFSDKLTAFTINSESYLGLGKLMSITSSTSEIRASGGELMISIAGIPNSAISEIVNSKIKGAPVNVYRALFNSSTGAFLSITGNPMNRYQGFINNYTLSESWDQDTRTSSNTITFTCASTVDVLQRKLAGRKTNSTSQNKYFPTDVSFDRVPNLVGSTFNFGAPE